MQARIPFRSPHAAAPMQAAGLAAVCAASVSLSAVFENFYVRQKMEVLISRAASDLGNGCGSVAAADGRHVSVEWTGAIDVRS